MGDQTIEWLRGLAAKGGRGVVNNIDARCLGRIADDLERLRDALQFIVDGYPNPNINHVDFRVGAYQAALSVLDAPFSQSPAQRTPVENKGDSQSFSNEKSVIPKTGFNG